MVSLTSAMRMNLLSLKRTSSSVSEVRNHLATGLKINSAIDNPSSYYTAVSLSNRASDLNSLLDNMGQAIQTVKAAVEGIASATAFLEQMSSIAEQATSSPVPIKGRPVEEFIKEGYKVINSEMSTSEIEALITDGAKLVLAGDMILSETLNIKAHNVVINGNGHKLSFKGNTGKSAISVSGSAEISNIKIEAEGTGICGIQAKDSGHIKIDPNVRISVSGTGSMPFRGREEALFNGKANTQAILNQIGADGLVANAANQFYVGSKTDANFGQGNWYIPAIGELMEVYGYDTDKITSGNGTSGMAGTNRTIINKSLAALKAAGVEAEKLTNSYYWSSSEYKKDGSWILDMAGGYRNGYGKIGSNYYVRCFQFLENKFNPSNGETAPKIGDVMYSDLSYGSADDYNGGKTAVGIVTWVSEDGKSAKIMNLKDLTFNSGFLTNNFNPDNPYNNTNMYTQQTTNDKNSEDISEIKNYSLPTFLNAIKSEGSITIEGIPVPNASIGVSSEWSKAYNDILTQYDMLINDSSYRGINLLKGEELNVIFNENKSSRLNIAGRDISSAALGLSTADWKNIADVSVSIFDLRRTTATLRSLSGELGNNYSVVQGRQDFTENLVNILTEGADKLTLADMNEESAIMLALQTRQQLAINSLSLASQSSQSVLRLFA